MELTYTNQNLVDVGYLDYSYCDFAWGANENDFAMDLSDESPIPERGVVVYEEGDEVGGIVRGVSVSDAGTARISGPTWTGVMAERVLCPDVGQAYWSVGPCDASDAARMLIERIGLSSLFCVIGSTGVTVRHTFDGSRDELQADSGRYMDGWAAMWQLCVEHGLSIAFSWNAVERMVCVSVTKARSLVDDESMTACANSVSYEFGSSANHLVCLGQGELAEREVIHLYADSGGAVSRTQSIFGRDEIAAIYDDPTADTPELLESRGAEALRRMASDATSVNVIASGLGYRLGDFIGGAERRTGKSARAIVIEKIVRREGNATSVEYETSIR